MKFLQFVSKVKLGRFKTFSIKGDVSLKKAKQLNFKTKFVSNTLSKLSFTSIFFDGSGQVNISSKVAIGGTNNLNFLSKTLEIRKSRNHSFASRVKLLGFMQMGIRGELRVQTVGSILFKSRVKSGTLKQYNVKSFAQLREREDFRLRAKIILKDVRERGQVSLRSAFQRTEAGSQSKVVSISSIYASANRLVYFSSGREGILSNEIFFKANDTDTLGSISIPLAFFKQPTINLGGVASSYIPIYVPMTISLASKNFNIISLHADTGKVNGILSNSISFSIFRDIINFGRIEESALNIDVHVSGNNFAKTSTEIYIEMGDNLTYSSPSVYRKIISPYRREDNSPTEYYLSKYSQKIRINNRASKHNVSKSSVDRSVSVQLSNKNKLKILSGIPLSRGISVPIGKIKQTILSLPSTLDSAIFFEKKETFARVPYFEEVRRLKARVHIPNLTYGIGSIEWGDTTSQLEALGLYYQSNSSTYSISITPNPPAREPRVFDGEAVTYKYILNQDGTIQEAVTLTHQRINSLNGISSAYMKFSPQPYINLNGIGSYVNMGLFDLSAMSLESGMFNMQLKLHRLIDLNGVLPKTIHFKTTVKENRNGIISTSQPFSANIFFSLESVSVSINFRTDI